MFTAHSARVGRPVRGRRLFGDNRLATACRGLLRITFFALLVVLTGPVWAQSDMARLTGVVTDTSGGVIAGATVTATDTATNAKLETTTNADGVYVFPVLKAGTYVVEVAAPSFKRLSRPEVVLRVNQVLSLNLELEPGDVTDVIEVTSGAPLVETASLSVGQTITGRQIIDLPINGRNFTQLATLIPGVTRGTPGSNADGSGGNAETFRQGDTGSAALSANGLREQNNNFTLDGIDNNESIVNSIVFFPPIEAIEEFRVITSVAPAEFGRGGGAIVSATIRSGSNGFHGSAFEFFRNSAMDARATDLVGFVPPSRFSFGISLAARLAVRFAAIRHSSLWTISSCASGCRVRKGVPLPSQRRACGRATSANC